MSKNLLILCFMAFFAFTANSQSYDFESDPNSITFEYFGSSISGQNAEIIDNPNATGVNTSGKVVSYVKAAASETWAGAFTNLPTPFDVTAGGQICVDVHFDHMGNLAFKLEKATNGVSNWVTTVENTVMGEWETLCYDLDANGLEDAMTPATGGIFEGVAIFFDFQSNDPDNDVTTYFDNIRYVPPVNCNALIDFEAGSLDAAFGYFGNGDLSDTPASNIANPNPTGINTSATVLEFTKKADAMTWAGAFPTPQPTVDATMGGEICVDVHMDHIGVVGLKLEQSTTGGGNWIQTVANTKINEWEQVCIDVSLNGLEDDMTPASGHAYGQLVIFPDFGTAGTGEDVTSYFDNMCFSAPVSNETYDVTFEVDMNAYSDAFTQPYVSGTFNSWSPDANPLSDDDGDGIWSTTINMSSGGIEYKFQLDGWMAQDMFLASDECVTVFEDDQGQVFINRAAFITETGSLGTPCFSSCYSCGDESTVIWNLNMSQEDVSDLGVYVAGGVFGHAELPSMTDDDGDGIYTFTLRRQTGFESDYTFLNGICLPNWDCKEDIALQDCAVDPFNDRHLGPLAAGTTEISTCFGVCSETTECSGPMKFMATFNVDMTLETTAADGLFLAGAAINGWNPSETPMSDDDGDDIWSVTVELLPGDIEYKFVNGDGGWEELVLDTDCMLETGGFVNRVFTMEEKDTTLVAYQFNSCNIAVSNKETFVEDLFTIQPNVVTNYANVNCTLTDAKRVELFDLNGRLIQSHTMAASQTDLELDLTAVSSGLYVVSVTSDKYISTKRLVVR